MRRTPGLFAVAMAALFEAFFAGSLLAAERVALVIGNAAYEHTTALRNPRNDAMDVARSLEGLGFAVIKGLDVDKSAFGTKLREFARASRGSKVTLLFYAGHGLQVEGENYLVPTDAKLAEEVDLSLEAYELSVFLRQMRGATNLVFLDACRDNPLARGLSRSMGPTRSSAIGRGLGRVESMSGTLVAYATQPGNVAEDGEERNSPFTAALLKHIMAPGLSVNDLLTAVTDEVVTGTGGTQQPWTHSSLRKPFYFNPVDSEAKSPSAASVGVSAPAGASAEQPAARAYEAAERVHTVEAYEVVRRRFPGTTYAELARMQLGKLAETGTAGVVPGAEPSAQPPATPQPTEALPVELESSLGLGLEERRRVQVGLSALGFSPGPLDGMFGPRTRAAIGAYRKEKGLPAGEHLTRELFEALGEEARAEARRREELARNEEADRRAEKTRMAVAARLERERLAQEEARRAEEDRPEPQRLALEANQREALTWTIVSGCTSVLEVELYLKEFPDGEHVRDARECLERLARSEPRFRFNDGCASCPELVLIPAGTYTMGSERRETGRTSSEEPRHDVTIGVPIAVGTYEVTLGEFRRFVEETEHRPADSCYTLSDKDGEWKPRDGFSWRSPGYDQTDRHPVVCVGWEDAKAYVDWLSDLTKKDYRLLSESEWEYAARAGTSTPRYWGKSTTSQCRHENGLDRKFAKRYPPTRYPKLYWRTVNCNDKHVHTAPVGSFGSRTGSAFMTCWAMHGNGWRTAGTMDTPLRRPTMRRPMEARGRSEETVLSGSCAAGRGPTSPRTCVPPRALLGLWTPEATS